jgi:hypothetical protein
MGIKKNNPKLVLHKETVADLSSDDMNRIQGGKAVPFTYDCIITSTVTIYTC